jgi:hypothetical protein
MRICRCTFIDACLSTGSAVLVHRVGRSRQVACLHFASFVPVFLILFSSVICAHLFDCISVCSWSYGLKAMFQGIDDGPGRWVLVAIPRFSGLARSSLFWLFPSTSALPIHLRLELPQGPPRFLLHNASPDAVLSSMTLHSRYWFCFCFSELISALFGNRTFWRIMVLITDGIHGTDCWGCWGIPFDPAMTAFGHAQHTDRGL